MRRFCGLLLLVCCQASWCNAIPKAEPLSRYGNTPYYEVNGKGYHVLHSAKGFKQRGVASWYGPKFHKKRTSSGEPYNMYAMTAAHKRLPIPSYVRVTDLRSGRKVVVKVNDRGPFHDDRIIDLSYAAASKLGMVDEGTTRVEIEVLQPQHTVKLSSTPAFKPAKLYLQLGAFRLRENAARFAEQVSAIAGHRSIVSQHSQLGHPLYHVKIGPIAHVNLLNQLYKKLATAGHGQAFTIVE